MESALQRGTRYCKVREITENKMAGTRGENVGGRDAQKDSEGEIVFQKKREDDHALDGWIIWWWTFVDGGWSLEGVEQAGGEL